MRAAIVLAAGRSTRFGRADKLFAALRGVPLLLHAIRVACAAPAARVLVVTARPARVRALVRHHGLRRVQTVSGAGAGSPLSASLRCGIGALRPIERDAFIFLGDMPDVDPRDAARLTRRLRPGIVAVRPRRGGAPGHPVLVRKIRTRPLGEGDAGFRIDRALWGWIPAGPGSVRDVDRRRDLARIRRRGRPATGK